MIDRLSWLVLEKAYAQGGLGGLGGVGDAANKSRWFDVFNPFSIPLPGGDTKASFANILGYIMGWVMAIVVIIAFVYLIISGVNYITAGGDAEKATKARTGILNAIIGIVVVVLAYFILRFAANLGGNVVNRPS